MVNNYSEPVIHIKPVCFQAEKGMKEQKQYMNARQNNMYIHSYHI